MASTSLSRMHHNSNQFIITLIICHYSHGFRLRGIATVFVLFRLFFLDTLFRVWLHVEHRRKLQIKNEILNHFVERWPSFLTYQHRNPGDPSSNSHSSHVLFSSLIAEPARLIEKKIYCLKISDFNCKLVLIFLDFIWLEFFLSTLVTVSHF